MTKLSSERLSKADLKFLLNLLNKAEEAQTEIEMDGDNTFIVEGNRPLASSTLRSRS